MKQSEKQIRKWRREGKTLKEISEIVIPKVTGERIRQILLSKNQCVKHNIIFTIKKCPYCSIFENYSTALHLLFKYNLDNEIIRLFDNTKSRDRTLVMQRAMLVKKMKDELDLSFSKIGQITGRHHTTIMNLYEKKY